MINQEIYDRLRAGGLTRAGALGVMGNMMAESSMKPNIAQRGMTKLSDEQYTAAADNNLIDFYIDAVGYGLCQWTYSTRKKALLEFAKKRGVSVGDPAMQVDFCLYELKTDCPALWTTLTSSDDIALCSDMVCSQYERPAVNNYAARQNFARKFADEITEYTPPIKDPVSATFPPDPSVWVLQLVMQFNGYWEKPTGHKSKDFFKKLREFVEDMEGC